jgi:23S rRNA pseudouridine1911/1915/1917 synthase
MILASGPSKRELSLIVPSIQTEVDSPGIGRSSGRLDSILHSLLTASSEFSHYSRAQIKKYIEQGAVSVNEQLVLKAGTLVSPEDTIRIVFEAPTGDTLTPYEHPLNVLYEDDYLIVVDKPPGLTVHPGAGNKDRTLVHALAHHYAGRGADASSGLPRAGIVHRLDKDTSGVMVVAKHIEAHTHLAAQFVARTVNRRYRALVYVSPRSQSGIAELELGTIDSPLTRHPTIPTKVAVAPVGSGRHAVTHYRVLERFPYAALIECKLETGRTHQIRVHCASIGSPVIGDVTYGDDDRLPVGLERSARAFGRQALHAQTLEFDHPLDNRRLSFEAPVPDDMVQLISTFRSWR